MRILSHRETLVYYDGPHLIVAQDQLGLNYVCLLVKAEQDFDEFLCSPVSKGRLGLLLSGELDVRAIFEAPEAGELLDGMAADGDLNQITTEPVDKAALPDAYIPDSGVFLDPRIRADDPLVEESKAKNVAVIQCTLNPPEALIESKISAWHLSQAIMLFQRLVKHSYSKALKSIKIDSSIREFLLSASNYELQVLPFSEGSFTINMQSAAGVDLLGYSYISRAFDLIDSINFEIEDPPQVVEAVARYGGHFASAYKEFLGFIVETEMPFSYRWTMPSKQKATTVNILPRIARPVYEALKEKVDIGVEERNFVGRLTKIDEKYNTWRLISDDDGKEYYGSSEIKLAGLTIETVKYQIKCEERLEEDRATGRDYTKLIIKDIKVV